MTALRTSSTRERSSLAPGPSIEVPVSIENVRSLLTGLDRRQRQAVTHGDGPLLVVAGPGTGKTEVITRRIAWLIASRRARPSEILALTFTERAADEMQARVDVLVPYGQADTAIQTFHAFADRLVREHGHLIGSSTDPRVISHPEAAVLLRERLSSTSASTGSARSVIPRDSWPRSWQRSPAPRRKASARSDSGRVRVRPGGRSASRHRG